MARDHALAATLRDGAAMLRLYRWARPTLSLGRNEPALDVYHPRSLRRAGVDVVRRPTGGRAVLHHRELTYAVALPVRALGGVRAAYRRVNEAIVRGLSMLGVEAEIAAGTGRTPLPDAGACFRSPAPGEIVAGGRKLVGSAQARIHGTLLQHGSILLDDDQERVPGMAVGASAAMGARTERAARAASLRELLGATPAPERVVQAVVAGFRATLPGPWTDDVVPMPAAVESGLEEHYRSDAWTWRR